MAWKRLLLGNVRFDEAEEYLAFKYTFGVMMMWSVLPLLVLFIIGDWSGTNRIGAHGTTVRIYFVMSCLLIWVLRGRKQWFVPVTWAFAGVSYLAFISAFMFVPTDELRVVWFYSLVAGTYILLGQQAGMLFTAASIAAVALGNPYQAIPLSVRTMGTFVTSLVSLSVIFHVFSHRTVAFYSAMLRSNERWRHLSDHDALTGVLNARGFAEACERLIRLGERRETPYAVLFIDLDHFKRVNDRFGHDAGDNVLRVVANSLRTRLRQSDLVGRVGGEEFVAFLPDTDAQGALQLAESLRQDIQACHPRVSDACELEITASIGVATCLPGQVELDPLQRQADMAMYRAKALGRNRVTLFESSLMLEAAGSR